MANRISGRPWTLDTATPGVPLINSWVKITNVIWSGYAAAATMSLVDVNGAVVMNATAKADLSDVVAGARLGWVHGLTLQQLSGGLVTVYIE